MSVVTPEPQNSTGNNPAPKRKSGVVVPHKPKWHQRLGAIVVSVSLRALLFTVRCRLRDHSEFFAPGAPAPAIFCIWHNRLGTCIKVLTPSGVRTIPARAWRRW